MNIYNQVELWLKNETVKNIIILILVYAVLTYVSRILKRTINRNFQDSAVRVRLRTSVSSVFTIFLVIAGLSLFSTRLPGLTIAFGVAGAGIAFSLQEVIASVAGWFAIHFGKFFSIGDRILLGGIKGDVIEIGFLRTTVMELGNWVQGDQYNGRVVRISNSFVFKGPVFNYSADFPFVWDEITIPIKYGSDLKLARKLIEQEATKYLSDYEKKALLNWKKLVDKYVVENALVDNQVYLTADQNWASFTLRYVTDFKLRRRSKDVLFQNILEAIDASSGKVKIATTAIEVSGNDNLLKALRKVPAEEF